MKVLGFSLLGLGLMWLASLAHGIASLVRRIAQTGRLGGCDCVMCRAEKPKLRLRQ